MVLKSSRPSVLCRLTDFFCAERPIHAAYPHHQHLSTNVRNFIDLLAKRSRAANQQRANGDLKVLLTPIATDGALPAAQFEGLGSEAEQPQV
jgi:hypothetical protein